MSLPDVEAAASTDVDTDPDTDTDTGTDTDTAATGTEAAGPLAPGAIPQQADGDSEQPPAKRSLLRRFGPAAIYLAIGIGLFFTYVRISQTFEMNSDGANNALQGWDMLHGHLLLHNWIIGDATYYTLELPLFAITEAFTGLTPNTTHVVAAVTLVVVIIATAALARGEARGKQAVMRYIIVVGILSVPLRNVGATSVIDSNPEHFGTGAILLLAFLLIERRAGRRLTPFLLAALLVAGEIGDATVLYVGALPIALVGAYRMLASRKLFGADAAIVVAAAASYPLEQLTRMVMRHLGGYTMVLPHTELSPSSHWLRNAKIVYRDVLIDFGNDVTTRPHTLVTVIGFVICLAAMLGGLFGFLKVLFKWRGAGWGEQLVVTAIAINLCAFAASTIVSQSNAREVIFVLAGSAVLAARLVGPGLTQRVVAGRVVMGTLAVAAVLPMVFGLMNPIRVTYTPMLAQWLKDHSLHYGIAPYSDAASISLQSGNAVQVRAVVHVNDRYAGYGWETRADWYKPADYDATFFIADPTAVSDRYTPADVEAVYGTPTAMYDVGPRVVMVYDSNLLDKVIPAHRAQG